jgi:YD repeat-containing protein
MKKLIFMVLVVSALFLNSCGSGGGNSETASGTNPSSSNSGTNELLQQTTTTKQVSYDPTGRITQENLGNGTTISYQYDENGNITSITVNR